MMSPGFRLATSSVAFSSGCPAFASAFDLAFSKRASARTFEMAQKDAVILAQSRNILAAEAA